MSILIPGLEGRHVRLEPLQPGHAPGLAQAAAGDPALYRWTFVPGTEAAATAETSCFMMDSQTTRFMQDVALVEEYNDANSLALRAVYTGNSRAEY